MLGKNKEGGPGLDMGLVRMAQSVRDTLGDNSLPVDIYRIAAAAGADVIEARMPIAVRGVCLTCRKILIINTLLSKRQRRFFLAHELGELLFPSIGGIRENCYNQLAGHLLIPFDDLCSKCSERMRFYSLIDIYDVPDSVLGIQIQLAADYLRWHQSLNDR